MRKTVLFVFSVFVALALVSTVLAATCGDGVAEGKEQCDGGDFRGYTCGTICYLDAEHPRDFEDEVQNPTNHAEFFWCAPLGELSCTEDCKVNGSDCHFVRCGDGLVEGVEECDDASENSDAAPDACRTDCRLPHCGDGVQDAGEQCDWGYWQNSDLVPDACRTDCTLPTCGDGVIDVRAGEECDDDSDSCFKCRRCREPTDDLEITKDTVLCDGHYQIDDQGKEGVIRVVGDGVTVRCGETYLYGVSRKVESLAPQIELPPLLCNRPRSKAHRECKKNKTGTLARFKHRQASSRAS